MTVAVIVHVEADRPYVDSMREKLEGVRLIACMAAPKTPIMAFDQRLPLVLVWSAQAAEMGAASAFAALANAHRGEIIFCVADETQRPRAFERLRGAVVDGSPRSSLFPGGLSAALAEAHRRQIFADAAGARARAVRPPATQGAFTGGVVRGLAGTVAVFGVGGAAAMAVEQIPDGLLATDHASAPVDVAFLDVPAEESELSLQSDLASGAWAESEIIIVDASQADVPLANPAPARVAAVRAAAFVTNVPLEVWTPDPDLVTPMVEFSDAPDVELTPWAGPETAARHDSAAFVSAANAAPESNEARPAI